MCLTQVPCERPVQLGLPQTHPKQESEDLLSVQLCSCTANLSSMLSPFPDNGTSCVALAEKCKLSAITNAITIAVTIYVATATINAITVTITITGASTATSTLTVTITVTSIIIVTITVTSTTTATQLSARCRVSNKNKNSKQTWHNKHNTNIQLAKSQI